MLDDEAEGYRISSPHQLFPYPTSRRRPHVWFIRARLKHSKQPITAVKLAFGYGYHGTSQESGSCLAASLRKLGLGNPWRCCLQVCMIVQNEKAYENKLPHASFTLSMQFLRNCGLNISPPSELTPFIPKLFVEFSESLFGRIPPKTSSFRIISSTLLKCPFSLLLNSFLVDSFHAYFPPRPITCYYSAPRPLSFFSADSPYFLNPCLFPNTAHSQLAPRRAQS